MLPTAGDVQFGVLVVRAISRRSPHSTAIESESESLSEQDHDQPVGARSNLAAHRNSPSQAETALPLTPSRSLNIFGDSEDLAEWVTVCATASTPGSFAVAATKLIQSSMKVTVTCKL